MHAGLSARGRGAAFALLIAGAMFASLLAAPGPRGLFGAGLALLMLAIARHDARHFVIPNLLVGTAFALALADAAMAEPGMAVSAIVWALVRAAVSGGTFLAVKLGYRAVRGRDGLGLGDVKLAAVAGAWLDWMTVLIAIDIAVVLALGAYLARQTVRARPLRAAGALPFGLYLAPAIWLGWLLEATLLGR